MWIINSKHTGSQLQTATIRGTKKTKIVDKSTYKQDIGETWEIIDGNTDEVLKP